MKYEDYVPLMEGFEIRLKMLDKLFLDIAAHGDVINSGKELPEGVLDKSLGELSQITSLLLTDCITVNNLMMVLIDEATQTHASTEQKAVMMYVLDIVDYLKNYPMLPTVRALLDDRIDSATLYSMVEQAPVVKVELVPLNMLTENKYLHLMDTIHGYFQSYDDHWYFPVSEVASIPEQLFEDTHDKIGKTTNVPEMIMVRFIANHLSIMTSFLNTTLAFKADI